MGKNVLPCRRPRFDSWVRKVPWRREWLLTPVFLPGESHEQKSLAGYSPWSRKELDITEQIEVMLNRRSVVATRKQDFGRHGLCSRFYFLEEKSSMYEITYNRKDSSGI